MLSEDIGGRRGLVFERIPGDSEDGRYVVGWTVVAQQGYGWVEGGIQKFESDGNDLGLLTLCPWSVRWH
jgi:hypothetical protein